ncbi:MAG: Zeta toxin [Candidatus Magasanikbacteria bacterium]|nr:Zeta toxin [Candidatus Magasanikbacteria bacterium]
MTDEEIRLEAIEFARRNKNKIARSLTDTHVFAPEAAPVSFFMAGSPGAGKTELSKRLIENEEGAETPRVVRIDGDDIRPKIPGYLGNNSHLFNGAVSLIVEKIHDLVLHNSQSFVFDGIMSKYEKALQNIDRSLAKKRYVVIFYIYQDPLVAWRFTEKREKVEGRNIPKEAFIEEFFGAHDAVNKVHQNYGQKVRIFIVKKDFEKNNVEDIRIMKKEISSVDQFIGKLYTKNELERLL